MREQAKTPESSFQRAYLRQKKREREQVRVFRALLLVSFLVLWEVAADLRWIDPFIFSSPVRVGKTFVTLLTEQNLLRHIGITVYETGISFLLVSALGMAFAVLLWLFPRFSAVMEPYLVVLNLAKQLNVVMTQLGVSADSIVMNVGSAAVGYGYEYVVSTLDRIKAAALSQDDKMLQMPIITPIASETWNVKEAMATEEESPEWGNQEVRGVSMEIQTAAASLASGSDAVILKHPQSVATISKMIQELM